MLNYSFDSEDERIFWLWLEELSSLDLVEIKPDKESFILNDPLTKRVMTKSKAKKVKIIEKEIHLLKSKVYTPDFIFRFKDSSFSNTIGVESIKPALTELYTSSNGWCYVDVKGSFTRNLTSSITFPDRQVMLYQRHDIYVNKVIPYGKKACLFKSTFYPEKFIQEQVYKVGAKKGQSKLTGIINTLKEFLKQ